MKNSIRLFGFIAFVAVIGFSFAACVEPEPNNTTYATGELTIGLVNEGVYQNGLFGTVITAVYDGPEPIESYAWKCSWFEGDGASREYKTSTGTGKDFRVYEGDEEKDFEVTVTFEGDYYDITSPPFRFREYSYGQLIKEIPIINQLIPAGALDGIWYKTCYVDKPGSAGNYDAESLLIIDGLKFKFVIFLPDFSLDTITDFSRIDELNYDDINYCWKGDSIFVDYDYEGEVMVKDRVRINFPFTHYINYYEDGWQTITFSSTLCAIEVAGDGESFTLTKKGNSGSDFLPGTWVKDLPQAPDPEVPEIFTSVAEITAYLAGLPANTAAAPVLLTVQFDLGNMPETGSGWRQLMVAINTAGKYVDLDLSACTMNGTTFNPDSTWTTSSGKDKIVSVTLPDTATSIGPNGTSTTTGAFNGFTALTSVSGTGLTSIGNYAFYGRTSLTSITIPDSMKSIGMSAFSQCKGLTSVTIPGSVTSIGDFAFLDCTGLTGSLTIPDSVITIGSQAFSGSNGSINGLTSLSIGIGVTSIGGSAFYNCPGLESITVASGNTAYRSEKNCLIQIGDYDDDLLMLGCKNSVIPTSVTTIGYGAFQHVTMTSITIPSNVTEIGGFAFNGCTGLTIFTIPGTVTKLGNGAFELCTNLTSVTFGAGSAIFISNPSGGNFGNNAFPEGTDGYGGNSLRTAYNGAAQKAGTYTRTANGTEWAKQ